MARLLKRARKEISLSTGVCDPVVIVDVNFHSATALDSDAWEEIDYDLSLLRQMNREDLVASPPDQLSTPTKSGVRSALRSTRKFVRRYITPFGRMRNVRRTASASQLSGIAIDRTVLSDVSTTASVSSTPIGITVLPVVKKHGGPKAFLNYLRRGFSLYLKDTGGQVEFQEMIALLVVGPSIFFFVFRIDRDFQSKFIVEFRASENESTNRYTSSITTEEALLQCLSSVYAMGTLGNTNVKTYKPLLVQKLR